jgi:hypothetical protein
LAAAPSTSFSTYQRHSQQRCAQLAKPIRIESGSLHNGLQKRRHTSAPVELPYNKVLELEDWSHTGLTEWCTHLATNGGEFISGRFAWPPANCKNPVTMWRKQWEWNMALRLYDKLGLINPRSRVLAVGAGIELPLYYLGLHAKSVLATDIYDTSTFVNEAPKDFLDKFHSNRPFEYDRSKMTFRSMDGTDLSKLANASFDIVFSFSSIEHFGGHQQAAKSVTEQARVLAPGGALTVVSELLLAGGGGAADCGGRQSSCAGLFTPQAISEYIIQPGLAAGLQLYGAMDFNISAKTLANAHDVASYSACAQQGGTPPALHTVLVNHESSGYYAHTSFAVQFVKPSSDAGDALKPKRRRPLVSRLFG